MLNAETDQTCLTQNDCTFWSNTVTWQRIGDAEHGETDQTCLTQRDCSNAVLCVGDAEHGETDQTCLTRGADSNSVYQQSRPSHAGTEAATHRRLLQAATHRGWDQCYHQVCILYAWATDFFALGPKSKIGTNVCQLLSSRISVSCHCFASLYCDF